ncbi:MAG TPA: alpha/beta fold hydrolase [Chitinophagales bacterium]|nr:alpha/beta fold hydrolase [Chitinophagales bacterium]
MKRIHLLALLLLIFSLSCKKESTDTPATDYEKYPIIMVHGFLASGDTYEKQMLRFASNGYDLNMLYTFDWNSLNVGANNIDQLDRFVDEVLAKTGSTKIDLVGHSAGSGLVFEYSLADYRAKKVRSLVMLAGTKQTQTPGTKNYPVRALNIYSPYDKIVQFGGKVNGTKNVSLADKDHYEVATCPETFTEMYQLFTGEAPKTTDVIVQNNPTISGKVLSFGENLTGEGATLEIYELISENGFRISRTPEFTFSIKEDNSWGPIQVKSNTHYEFKVFTGKKGDRPVHYYREPFTGNNKNVLVRFYPPSGSLAAVFLTNLPNKEDQSAMAFFSASQAVIVGRDQLNVNGNELANNQLATAENTTIAMFMYDDNKNKKTDLNTINSFSLFPFLAGVDIYFPLEGGDYSTFKMNGRVLNVPNWPSASEGVAIAIFD